MKAICKYTSKYTLIAFVLIATVNVAVAGDLIGTAHSAGNGLVLEIGFANDETNDVSGVQFDIKLDAKVAASFENADLSSCLSGLPKAFSASSCTVIDDSTLRVVVLSMSGETVPSTILGTVKLPISAGQINSAGPGGPIGFNSVVMGDSAGNKIEAGLVDFSIGASNEFKGSKRQLINPSN